MKKILSLLLTCALLLSLLAGCGGGGETPSTTHPTEDTSRETVSDNLHTPAAGFAGGSGTEADPYQISNAAELALLSQLLAEGTEQSYRTASYVLTADISLNDTSNFADWANSAPEYAWEPIGRTSARFDGVFDGNGHTVSGIYIHTNADAVDNAYGLFGRVGGTVKNVVVEQSYIFVSGDGASVGSVAGHLAEKGAVENCSSSAMIEVNGWSNVGGIAGYGGRISGCTSLGSVSGGGYSGGIVGWASYVDSCVNKGSVSGNIAGGIAGNMYEAGTGVELDITECAVRSCTNEGVVSAVAAAGGILGRVGNDEVDIAMYITDCENYGGIDCGEVSAGIIGNLSAARASIISVENCVNHADITGSGKVGGVICELMGAVLHQKGDVTISNCENRGNITCTGMYSGGIVTYFMLMGAETDLRLNIENCVNSGNITSQSYAGGILCFSTSAVAMDLEITGDSAINFKNCDNSGDILGLSSNSFVGGIAGNFSAEGIRALFESCTNSGSVKIELSLTEDEIKATQGTGSVMTISQIVGGIVGRLGEGTLLTTDHDDGSGANINAADAWIIFRDCRNSGTLEATDYSAYVTADGQQIWKNYIGGIIGNTCAEDAYSFSVENCTYSGADRGLGNAEYPDVGQPH